MVKQALKRRKPGFNESYYGFRSFNSMLEAAAQAGSWSSSETKSPAAIACASPTSEE